MVTMRVHININRLDLLIYDEEDSSSPDLCVLELDLLRTDIEAVRSHIIASGSIEGIRLHGMPLTERSSILRQEIPSNMDQIVDR
jgi:hypothetical protein